MPNLNKLARWSRHFDSCVECGKDESPHKGRGLCGRCYDRSPEQAEKHRQKMRDYARIRRQSKLEGKWSPRHDACILCGRRDRPHAAHGRCVECKRNPPSIKLPFPRIGAECELIVSGEVGQIVGYSELYGEWRVQILGEEALLWEPCDLAPIADEHRRAS